MKKFLQTKSLAITSLVFGILAIVFSRGLIGLASALVAISIGLFALYAMKQSGDLTGRTKARWGLGLGISSVIILLIMLAVEVRTQRAIEGLRQSNPELFNASIEKPTVTAPVQRRPTPQEGASFDEMLADFVASFPKTDAGRAQMESLLQKAELGKPTFDSMLDDFVASFPKTDAGRAQEAIDAYMRDRIASQRRTALKAAEQGDAEAQFNLALTYDLGKGVKQDYKEAVKWYTKAAEQGLADAQVNLGYFYYNGQGVPKDYKKAVKWYTKAAEQGLADAQVNLGSSYAKGEGVIQDYKEAIKWFRKAAEQGLANAQVNLGSSYAKGEGVIHDYREAVKWYTKAAEQGVTDAQYNLGVMYNNGQGIAQDYKEAVKWHTKAAEQGDADAQVQLGIMYGLGQGIVEDYVESYRWFLLAEMKGADVTEYKNTLRALMTPEQVAQAQRSAKAFVGK